jgi:DNA (cytosine-5)-methyltransferase 1
MPQSGRVGYGVLSFFSGIGVLDLGFENAGFRTWMASELYRPFADGYAYARACMGRQLPVRGMYTGNFEGFLDDGWRRLSLLSAIGEVREECGLAGFIGGPPCPDFSIAGRQAGVDGINGRLTQRYADLICAVQPDFFVFENVAGLWTGKHLEFYARIRRQLGQAGYHITDKLLNTIQYGVPQDRQRVLVIGLRERSFPSGAAEAAAAVFPWESGASAIDMRAVAWPSSDPFVEEGERPLPPGVPERLTVEWWFRRNRVDQHDNAGHSFQPRSALERFRSIREGDTAGKSFKRLHRWRYSPTAAYGNNEVHLHPYRPRRISAAEAMAIQSLPRSFALPHGMSLSDMFKAVGNAVPLLFAEAIAGTLRSTLDAARAPDAAAAKRALPASRCRASNGSAARP